MLDYLKQILKQKTVNKAKVGAPSAKIDTNLPQTLQRRFATDEYP